MAGSPMHDVLVCLASIHERESMLERTLISLCNQSARGFGLMVRLNGYASEPSFFRELPKRQLGFFQPMLSKYRLGAESKLWAAAGHDGVYVTCDDDVVYADDYVERMAELVRRQRCMASITGKYIDPAPPHVRDATGHSVRVVHESGLEWTNAIDTAYSAFDTREVGVPRVRVKNHVDPCVSVWAQERGIPVRVAPRRLATHQSHPEDGPQLWKEKEKAGNRVFWDILEAHEAKRGWSLFSLEDEAE